MADTLISSIEPALSPERLARYRPNGTSTDPNLDILVNYMWNIALADSLHCSLSAVEIALRNTIHGTLTVHFGTPNWYDQTGIMDAYQQDEIERVKAKIRLNTNPITPGRVVAGLTFGFWVTTLSRNYEARLWRANKSETIKQAFPYVPRRKRQRGSIHEQYNRIRALRNRVSHHEPLFDDPNLNQLHHLVQDGIEWINPELRSLTAHFDSFPAVLSDGRVAVESRINDYLSSR